MRPGSFPVGQPSVCPASLLNGFRYAPHHANPWLACSGLRVRPVSRHCCLSSVRPTKKADATQHPRVLNHVGLLFNGPPGTAGLPFI